jgi:hypothetical protein
MLPKRGTQFGCGMGLIPLGAGIVGIEAIVKELLATGFDGPTTLEIAGEDLNVTCTQIAGILARRIVCWPKEGDNLERGQKFGLIKFSSRTDVMMPPNVEIAVSIGDKVKGGETIIGRLQTDQ